MKKSFNTSWIHQRVMSQGLTLIELIVVLAIFMIVAAILMFNYASFKTDVTLRNLTEDIALSVRKAQIYATSSHEPNNKKFDITQFPGYGLSFAIGTNGSSNAYAANGNKFILFADVPSNGVANNLYDRGNSCGNPSVGNECVEVYTITTGDYISQICTDGTCVNNGAVVLTFHRPSPDAILCSGITGVTCSSSAYSSIQIVVTSSDKKHTRTITIWNTGQISVSQ